MGGSRSMIRALTKYVIAIAILSMLLLNTVKATSWVDLKPEEVLERATVIVQGTYDFSKKLKGSNSIWIGYAFNVEQVYKGSASSTIIAGIDGNDTGWVDAIQREHGSFVLFLEQQDGVDFLTPVGGPNGMIHMQNNEIQHHDENDREFFSQFLKNTNSYSPDKGLEKDDTASSWNYLVIGLICAFMIAVLYIVYRKRKNLA